jgi:PHD/YefM family antitoxin component YafN of YafNO toxin-antitoxin module
MKENWQPSAYPGYPGYPENRGVVSRPKSFWPDQDPYSEKETQRSSYEESDVPTISEPKERHRSRRRHSFSELDKPRHARTKEELACPGEQKYIKSESAKRGELRNFHPRERDFDYLKRPKYATDEAVISKPGRPVRVFASPKDYQRSQERSELDDARNRQISEYLSPKERQRERQEHERGGQGRHQTDYDRRESSPSRRLPTTDNDIDTVDYGYGEKYETHLPDAENHYHYLSDLEHDKERIDRMVFEAQKRVQKQEKQRLEKEKKEQKKMPQTTEQVIAPGVIARTLKSPCPACFGEGQQTHTEIQYQAPPQVYGYAPSPVMGQPAYAPSPVMGQPAYTASPVIGQPAYPPSPLMGQPAPVAFQPGPVTFTPQISPPQPQQFSYIQPALNVPYAQLIGPAQMTSTPAQNQQ